MSRRTQPSRTLSLSLCHSLLPLPSVSPSLSPPPSSSNPCPIVSTFGVELKTHAPTRPRCRELRPSLNLLLLLLLRPSNAFPPFLNVFVTRDSLLFRILCRKHMPEGEWEQWGRFYTIEEMLDFLVLSLCFSFAFSYSYLDFDSNSIVWSVQQDENKFPSSLNYSSMIILIRLIFVTILSLYLSISILEIDKYLDIRRSRLESIQLLLNTREILEKERKRNDRIWKTGIAWNTHPRYTHVIVNTRTLKRQKSSWDKIK